MKYIRNSEERGTVDLGWLQSKHSFSFGSYYDPRHMGISVLRVINDDTVLPGQGFGTHGHQDMEIISYVMEGKLAHKDSMGNIFEVPAGEVQRMSAGSGVTHSEYNASNTSNTKFLQIWIQPSTKGIKPSYEQKKIEQEGPLTPLVSPKGSNGTLSINQDASIARLVLKKNENHELNTGDRVGYLHIISGDVSVNGKTFSEGDAFSLDTNENHVIEANSELEALWFDLPNVA